MATAHLTAVRDSLNASMTALDKSPLNPFNVAYYVGLEAAQRDRKAREQAATYETPHTSTPALLGCWVDGKLKFKSRNHDAVYDYAGERMNSTKHRSVWVAPVGSFVDTDAANDSNRRAMRKVHKGGEGRHNA